MPGPIHRIGSWFLRARCLAERAAHAFTAPRRVLIAASLCAFATGAAWNAIAPATPASTPAPSAPVIEARINGAIGPAVSDHVKRVLARAAQEGAQLVVLRVDTPGGLDVAMRDIIQAILGSSVPVACHVAPQGARAASAGMYILYACHVAAMAPATNLGAATPVEIGMSPAPAAPASAGSGPAGSADAMQLKRLNDAIAYVRSLAQLRSRNGDFAELAVRHGASLSAQDALAQRVIDLIAADTPELLRRIDGRVLATPGGSVRMATATAPVRVVEADLRARVLSVLSDPSLALVLMMLGIYGLLFEFANPGFVLPGVVGGVCLLLALFGLQMLPLSYAGLGFVLLGLAFFIGEAFVPTSGALAMGGVASFALGALMLVDSDTPGFGVAPMFVGTLALLGGLCALGLGHLARRTQRRPQVSGVAALVGAEGALIEFDESADARDGWADVRGERWRVHAQSPMVVGQRVRVLGVRGLVLDVAASGSETRGA